MYSFYCGLCVVRSVVCMLQNLVGEGGRVTIMAYSMYVNIAPCIHVHGHSLRPGKVDLLFLITYFFNLDAGGRSLFARVAHATITHCAYVRALLPQQCITINYKWVWHCIVGYNDS